MKYRKKPVVVDAVQFNNSADIHEFCGDFVREPVGEDYLEIKTLEGIMRASKGDYIIKGVNGEFYPCKPDIFEKTYELADKEVIETAKAVVDAINKMQRQTLASRSILNI